MPYSVIIGDTRGVPSLSHVRPAAFYKGGGRKSARFGMRAKLRKDIRAAAARPSPGKTRVRATWWCACVCGCREFHVCAGIHQDTRQSRERHYRGGALGTQEIRICRAAPIKRARRQVNFTCIVVYFVLSYSSKIDSSRKLQDTWLTSIISVDNLPLPRYVKVNDSAAKR